MSRFFSERHAALVPYTPGEQPQIPIVAKLNTNESPYPPSEGVARAIVGEIPRLQLYNDPECAALRAAAAEYYGVGLNNLLAVNGSDEALYFAFLAFCDEKRPVAFPDITYGFYPVFASFAHVPARVVPLREDFTIDPEDYCRAGETVVIANPNAPTGLNLGLDAIRKILDADRNRVVVVDEAYVDFGGETCVPLTKEYDNLLVVQTFSKSRSMAGARLGFAIGDEGLIRDLNTVRYAGNPYNVNRMTQAAGIASFRESDYYLANCRRIMATRDRTAAALREMGFSVLPSRTNVLLASTDKAGGKELYLALRDRGILVRWFDQDRIRDYIRVSIGSPEEMDAFLNAVREILAGRGERK